MGGCISKAFNWEENVGKVNFVQQWLKKLLILGGCGANTESEVYICPI